MGKCYRHIQSEDRFVIYEMLFQGEAIEDIAEKIGFHRSTLYRELARNSSNQGYRPFSTPTPQKTTVFRDKKA